MSVQPAASRAARRAAGRRAPPAAPDATDRTEGEAERTEVRELARLSSDRSPWRESKRCLFMATSARMLTKS